VAARDGMLVRLGPSQREWKPEESRPEPYVAPRSRGRREPSMDRPEPTMTCRVPASFAPMRPHTYRRGVAYGNPAPRALDPSLSRFI